MNFGVQKSKIFANFDFDVYEIMQKISNFLRLKIFDFQTSKIVDFCEIEMHSI